MFTFNAENLRHEHSKSKQDFHEKVVYTAIERLHYVSLKAEHGKTTQWQWKNNT